MMPVTFVTINDLHLTTRPPQSRIDDYISEMQDLLLQVERVAKAVDASAVLIAGDTFHLKGQVSYELLTWLYAWGVRVNAHAIPGNHDLVHNRYDSLPETALGLLFEIGAFTNVWTAPVWINNVLVAGVPYPDAFDITAWRALPASLPEAMSYADLENVALGKEPVLHSIVLGHCFASVEGGEHFGEPVLKYSDLAQLPFDVFVFGHDHTDGGVVELRGKTFINLGALSRGSLAADDLSRTVKCAVVEFSDAGHRVVQVALTARPVEELFDLEKKAQRDAEAQQIEIFVEELARDLPQASGSGLSFADRVKALSLPDAVYHKVLAYIADAEASAG